MKSSRVGGVELLLLKDISIAMADIWLLRKMEGEAREPSLSYRKGAKEVLEKLCYQVLKGTLLPIVLR